MTVTDGTQERAGLSEHEIRDVHSLLGQCLPVDVNIILEASEGRQFLHYRADTLVGVLGLRHDGEACLCVAPGARRKGIGRALIAAADECLTLEGVGEMLVECDASSAEGRAFLHAMGGTARCAEFRLRLSDPETLRAPGGKVHLARIGPEEIASFARATAVAFGDPIDSRLAEFERRVGSARYRFYVARVGELSVGGICAGQHGDETHLTSFHTVPEARRRGYGRDLLLQTCRTLIDEGTAEIILEVRTDNEAALGLYRSCGFQVVRRYDFYARGIVARDGGQVASKNLFGPFRIAAVPLVFALSGCGSDSPAPAEPSFSAGASPGGMAASTAAPGDDGATPGAPEVDPRIGPVQHTPQGPALFGACALGTPPLGVGETPHSQRCVSPRSG